MAGQLKPPVRLLWRKLNVPAETELLGVENDMYSEWVEFILPKEYQVFDLSGPNMAILIDTMNQQNEVFDTVEPIKEIIDDTIHLFWTVGRIPPHVDGLVFIRIRVLGIYDDFVWQTETAQFRFAPTFKTSDPPEPWEMAYLDQIIIQVTRLRNETQVLRDETEGFRDETIEIREETRGIRNEAELEADRARDEADRTANEADNAARSASIARRSLRRAPYVEPTTGTWYQWSYQLDQMVDTGISAYGTRHFPITNTLPDNVPPDQARVNDLVVNTGNGPFQIGDQLDQPVGTVLRITQLDPFLCVPAGNIRGPAITTVTIVDTVTGAPGSPATIEETLESTSSNRKYIVTVPEGEQGIQGEQGPQGIPGPTTSVNSVTPDSITGDLILTPSDIGAAADSHTHDTSDIDSGILPMDRGGLDADNPITAKENLLVGAKILWEGTAQEGSSITIPDLEKYTVLGFVSATPSSIPYSVIAFKHGTQIKGTGGGSEILYPAGPGIYLSGIDGTAVGTLFTINTYRTLFLAGSGSIGSAPAQTLGVVYGII